MVSLASLQGGGVHIFEVYSNGWRGTYIPLECLFDIPSAFHQILVDEDSRDVLAFTAMNRKYRFKRVSFGLKNAHQGRKFFDFSIFSLIQKLGRHQIL